MGTIFVGGFLRSGTTMLQSIICASDDCNPLIGEAIYLRGTIENYWRSVGMFDLHSRFYFSDKEDLRSFCEKQTREFIERTAARYGNPKFLVLKHPQLTRFFPQLHELVAEAKFLVIVRDPRDIVASASRAQSKGAREFGDANPVQLAHSLMRSYLSCLKCPTESFRHQTIYVTYERLVRSPLEVIKQLQNFTGINLADFNPNEDTPRSSQYFNVESETERPFHSELYGKAISTSRIGCYAETLTPQDVRAIEQICKPLMELFKYESTS